MDSWLVLGTFQFSYFFVQLDRGRSDDGKNQNDVRVSLSLVRNQNSVITFGV